MATKRKEVEKGKVYGQLTVIQEAESDNQNHVMVSCKCSCGNEIVVRHSDLNRNDHRAIRSCGCQKTDRSNKATFQIGDKFGKLIIIADGGQNKHHHKLVKCKCDCGNPELVTVRLSKLRSKTRKQWTHSCGCDKKDNYLTYWGSQALKMKQTKIDNIFSDRCHGIGRVTASAKYKIKQPLVDAAMRLKQYQLLSNENMPEIIRRIEANQHHFKIAARFGMRPIEICWIHKSLRTEHDLVPEHQQYIDAA